jgi:UDP-N-acetylglucosamine 2-epimerase (non-hydrolysing)
MILIAFGTRPEIIKLFPVIYELKKKGLPFKTLFSGQQFDLYRDVRDLVPPPDFSFEKAFSGKGKHNTLGMSYVKICKAAEDLFSKERFKTVVVQGDTTTALAIAQMAFYNGIRVAHVEAGLRTFDLNNPYPEEFNRTLITRFADLNFAPTRQAVANLKKEGAKNIHLTGNTIVDAVNHFKKSLNLKVERGKSVLVTLHRRENHPIMNRLFADLNNTALMNPELEFILPIHPNPNVQRHRSILNAANIHVIQPVGYPEMLGMIAHAAFIISDSGGLQEEATCFNKRILIIRKVTERPEVVEIGLGKLGGEKIGGFTKWAKTPAPRMTQSPYGKGRAAEAIVRLLEKDIHD